MVLKYMNGLRLGTQKIKKAQKGFTIIELLIVIAIIGILAGLVLNNFQGAQAKARDVQRKSRINSIYGKLEEYYNNNSGYPDGNFTTTTLAGIDSDALKDTNGAAPTYSFQIAATTPTAPTLPTTSTSGSQFFYQAYGCTNATAQASIGATCAKYVLVAYQEKVAGGYTKASLN